MKRERIPIRPGDLIRCPDRATARWHRVVRVSWPSEKVRCSCESIAGEHFHRRRAASPVLVVRRSRWVRLIGLAAEQRVEWTQLRALGYAVRRAAPPATSAPAAETSEPPREVCGA